MTVTVVILLCLLVYALGYARGAMAERRRYETRRKGFIVG